MSSQRDSATNTEHDGSVHAQTAANSAQIVQVGISERSLLLFALCFFVVPLIISLWALVRAGDARDDAARAESTAELATAKLALEYRLAQEDLMMLRTAVKAHGIEVETAGDHE